MRGGDLGRVMTYDLVFALCELSFIVGYFPFLLTLCQRWDRNGMVFGASE